MYVHIAAVEEMVIAAFVTRLLIFIVGLEAIASLKLAVIITLSESLTILSESVSVSVTFGGLESIAFN